MRDDEGEVWDGMPAAGTDGLDRAVKAYRDRFNVPPPTGEFIGYRAALTREILAAVRRGERLTSAELHCRLGLKPSSCSAFA
jgi:hypothetical protein